MAEPKHTPRLDVPGGVHQALAHDSARKHVTGEAIYTDDIPPIAGLLHLAAGGAQMAHARLRKLE